MNCPPNNFYIAYLKILESLYLIQIITPIITPHFIHGCLENDSISFFLQFVIYWILNMDLRREED